SKVWPWSSRSTATCSYRPSTSGLRRQTAITSQSSRVRRWRRRFRPTTPVAPAISAFLRSGIGGRASRRPWRRRLLTIQLKRPISDALIRKARYFDYIRHWAKLPAINQKPGSAVRVNIFPGKHIAQLVAIAKKQLADQMFWAFVAGRHNDQIARNVPIQEGCVMFDTIDRIVNLDLGKRGVDKLYEPARARSGEALTAAAARSIANLAAGDRVALVTGSLT